MSTATSDSTPVFINSCLIKAALALYGIKSVNAPINRKRMPPPSAAAAHNNHSSKLDKHGSTVIHDNTTYCTQSPGFQARQSLARKVHRRPHTVQQ